jgi:hypothetical protein
LKTSIKNKKSINNILIIGRVVIDGFGDYFQILSVADILRNFTLPNANISILVTKERELPSIDPSTYGLSKEDIWILDYKNPPFTDKNLSSYHRFVSACIYHMQLNQSEGILEKELEELKNLFQSSYSIEFTSLIKKFLEIDCVFCIAFPLPNQSFWNLFLKKHHIFCVDIREYGGGGDLYPQEKISNPNTANYVMGVRDPEEVGLIFPRIPTTTFCSAHNWMFDSFLDTYFCYFRQDSSYFIQLVAAISTDSNVDIGILLKWKTMQWNQLSTNLIESLRINQVSQMVLRLSNGSETTVWENKELSTKKRLILMDPFLGGQESLLGKHEDILQLIHRSNFLVGCTGDASLSEVLSMGKLPVYDAADYKRYFWYSMVMLALHHFPDGRLAAILEKPLTYVQLLKNEKNKKEIYSQWQSFCEILRKNHNVERILMQSMQQALQFLENSIANSFT